MSNIADEKQVKKVEEEFKTKRQIELAELKILLDNKSFRKFMWRLLGETKTFHSIWEQSAKIHYNSGKQDFGHFLMGEISEANEEALFQMMRENKEIKKEEKTNA